MSGQRIVVVVHDIVTGQYIIILLIRCDPYLPEFPGAHSIADAYEAKVAQTGVTVHFVDEGVDTGPIIRQERVAIDPSWDLETLESHVHAMEYDLFWQVIEQVAKSIEEEK